MRVAVDQLCRKCCQRVHLECFVPMTYDVLISKTQIDDDVELLGFCGLVGELAVAVSTAIVGLTSVPNL